MYLAADLPPAPAPAAPAAARPAFFEGLGLAVVQGVITAIAIYWIVGNRR